GSGAVSLANTRCGCRIDGGPTPAVPSGSRGSALCFGPALSFRTGCQPVREGGALVLSGHSYLSVALGRSDTPPSDLARQFVAREISGAQFDERFDGDERLIEGRPHHACGSCAVGGDVQ